LQKPVFGYRFKATGIDQNKRFVETVDQGVVAVTGNTGGIGHDGAPMTQQTIEQCRFTHIGAAHQGNKRFHTVS